MIENISAVLSSIALALITMLGLVFIAYSIFWQRITKGETKIKPWKISKEEGLIKTNVKVIAWWATICIIFDFVFAYLLTFEMFKQLQIFTIYSYMSFLFSLGGLVLIINFAYILVFPSYLYLARVTLNVGRYNDARSNANDALTELAKYITPEKRSFNPLKRGKRRDVHMAYAAKGQACMGLAKKDLEKKEKWYQEAIESFSEGLKFNKKCQGCWVRKGISCKMVGKVKEASECFARAKNLNKKDFNNLWVREIDEWKEEKNIGS